MNTHHAARRFFFCLSFYLLPSAFYLCSFSACHRGPGTAAELEATLPRQFRGEVKFQGDPQPHTLVVEPHDFTVRSAHVLQFDRVRYQILAGGSNVVAEGDAGLRGTISTPGLDIRIEQVTDAAEAGGGEVIKADTFKGSLSADLHTADATWTSGLGQEMKLKVTATAP